MARSAPIVGAARGRGARSNRSGRFESLQREDFDDGWTEHDGEPKQIETVLHLERARKIISTNDSRSNKSGRIRFSVSMCDIRVYCAPLALRALSNSSPGCHPTSPA